MWKLSMLCFLCYYSIYTIQHSIQKRFLSEDFTKPCKVDYVKTNFSITLNCNKMISEVYYEILKGDKINVSLSDGFASFVANYTHYSFFLKEDNSNYLSLNIDATIEKSISTEVELYNALQEENIFPLYLIINNSISLENYSVTRVIRSKIHLNLNNQTIEMKGNGSNISFPKSNVFYVSIGGDLTITGDGTINGTKAGEYGYAITVGNGGKLTIENGSFGGDTTAIYIFDGTILLKGGYYQAVPYYGNGGNGYQYTINCKDEYYENGSAVIIITGGQYYKFDPKESHGENPHANYLQDGYSTSVDDNEVYTVSKTISISDNIDTENKIITLSCLDSDKKCTGSIFEQLENDEDSFSYANLTSTGDFIYQYNSYGVYNFYYFSSTKVSITSEAIKNMIPLYTKIIENPYQLIFDESGLKNALSMESSELFFKIMNDISLSDHSSPRTVKTKIHLDLNNKTISISENTEKNVKFPNSNVFFVSEGGDLTITGEGTLNGTNAGEYGYAITVRNGGILTIENGYFGGDTTAIYVIDGNAILRGGYYDVKPYYINGGNGYQYTINCYDASYRNGTCKILITGGTYFNFNPQNNNGENPVANYLPSGFTSSKVQNNEIFSVIQSMKLEVTKNNELATIKFPNLCEKEVFIASSIEKVEEPLLLNNDCKENYQLRYPGLYTLLNKEKNTIIGSFIHDNPIKYANNEWSLKYYCTHYNDITIQLTNNIVLTEQLKDNPLIIKTSIKINLNNYSITTTDDYNNLNIFQIVNGGKLTIFGNGELNGGNSNVVILNNNGIVTLENGNYIGFNTVINNIKGKVNIIGGYYQAKTDTEYGRALTGNENTLLCNDGCTYNIIRGKFVNYQPSSTYINALSSSIKDEGELPNYLVDTKYSFTFTKQNYFINDLVEIQCTSNNNGDKCPQYLCYFNQNEGTLNTLSLLNENTYSFTAISNGEYRIYYTTSNCNELNIQEEESFLKTIVNGNYYNFLYTQSLENEKNNLWKIEISLENFDFSKVIAILLKDKQQNTNYRIEECITNLKFQCFSIDNTKLNIVMYLNLQSTETYEISYLSKVKVVDNNYEEERCFEKKNILFIGKQNIKVEPNFALFNENQIEMNILPITTIDEYILYIGDIKLKCVEKTNTNSQLSCTYIGKLEVKENRFIFQKKNEQYFNYSQPINLATYTLPNGNCEIMSFNANQESTTTFTIYSSTNNIKIKDNSAICVNGQLVLPILEAVKDYSIDILYNDNQFESLTKITYVDNRIEEPLILSSGRTQLYVKFNKITEDKFITKIRVKAVNDLNKEWISTGVNLKGDSELIYTFDTALEDEIEVNIDYLNQCNTVEEYLPLVTTPIVITTLKIETISSRLFNQSEKKDKTFILTFNQLLLIKPDTISLKSSGEPITLTIGDIVQEDKKKIQVTLPNSMESPYTNGKYTIQFSVIDSIQESTQTIFIYDTTPKSLTFSSETDVTYPNNNTVNVKADNDFPFDLTEFDLVVVEKTKMSKKSYLEYYKDRDAYTIKQDKDGNNMISLSTFFNFNEEIKITHLCFKDLPTYEVKSQEELTKRILSAKEGDIIKLANNIDITNDTNEAINRITKKITLDLNGKTITMSNKMSINRSPIEVNTGGELTITGNGVIDSTLGGDAGYSIRVYGGGKVIIESGTFKGDTTSLFVINGYATIKGGYFEAKPWFDGQNGDPYRYTLNCLDGSPCDIQVQGGTFYRYDPEHSYSEDPAVNFVSSGYECEGNTINDDTGDYKKTEYKYYEVTKTFSNTQGLRNLYVNDKGLYEPESIYGCLSSETLISSSIPFEFGETQNIFFFKKGSEDKINLEFKLDFQNETSYNFYKDKIYIKNDIPNKILKCEPIEQKIADCKIELPMNSISLDIEGTPASKRIEVVLYSYNTLCQTKLTSGAYTVAELELDSQPTVLEKINSIQAGSIQFNKTEDKYTFDFTKNDAKENPITITFKGDSEHNAITLNEKVLLKDQLQLVEIYNTDTKEDSTTETSQDITIIFSGIVGNSDVSSFILTLNDTDDNIVSPGKNTKIEIKLEDSFCRFDTKDSNTIVLCFGLDFSSLAEGYYYLSYNDSCETPNSNKLSNNNNNDTLLFIKYVQPPEFKIPRHYFSLDTNESPSVTILSPDIAEDIKIYIQKEGETAKIKLELTKINDELKWTYTLTNGIYQLYYSINDGKKHEIVGKIIVVETIDKLIHIDTTNLCFFYKDLIQFDFVTDSQVDYSLIKVYIGSDQNKIEFVKGDNGYSVDLKEKDNKGTKTLYIIDNEDIDNPLYQAEIKFTQITLKTEYLYNTDTSIDFKDMTCNPKSITFSLIGKTIISKQNAESKYTFDRFIINDEQYGANKDVTINGVSIGKIFISKKVNEAAFSILFIDTSNITLPYSDHILGEKQFVVKSSDYYISNIAKVLLKYEGETNERELDTSKFTTNKEENELIFNTYIGFNDVLNIIQIKDNEDIIKDMNYKLLGQTFTVAKQYYVYPKDSENNIDVTISFSLQLPTQTSDYIVHYGTNDVDKIRLDKCTKKSDNDYSCSIPITSATERSIYINEAINKDKIKIAYLTYTIENNCQTLFTNKDNQDIELTIEKPIELTGDFEVYLTNEKNTKILSGNKNENKFILNKSLLSYELTQLIILYGKAEEKKVEIFSDEGSLITLYNNYEISEVTVSATVNETREKTVSVKMQFINEIKYDKDKIKVHLFEIDSSNQEKSESIQDVSCDLESTSLVCTLITNEIDYRKFAIKYDDMCGKTNIPITTIQLQQNKLIIPTNKQFKGDTVEVQCTNFYNNEEHCLGNICYFDTVKNEYNELTKSGSIYTFIPKSVGEYRLFYQPYKCEKTTLETETPLEYIKIEGIENNFMYTQYLPDDKYTIEISSEKWLDYSIIQSIALSEKMIPKCEEQKSLPCFTNTITSLELYIQTNSEFTLKYLSTFTPQQIVGKEDNSQEIRYIELNSPKLGKDKLQLTYDFALFADGTINLHFSESIDRPFQAYLGDIQLKECSFDESNILKCKYEEDELKAIKNTFKIKEGNNLYHSKQPINLATYTLPNGNCEIMSFNANQESTTTFTIYSSTNNIKIKDNSAICVNGQLVLPILEAVKDYSIDILYNDNQFESLTKITYVDNRIEEPLILSSGRTQLYVKFNKITEDKFITKIRVKAVNDLNKEWISTGVNLKGDSELIYTFDTALEDEIEVNIDYLNQCNTVEEYLPLVTTPIVITTLKIETISSRLFNQSEKKDKTFILTFNQLLLIKPDTISLKSSGEPITLTIGDIVQEDKKKIQVTLPNSMESPYTNGKYTIQFSVIDSIQESTQTIFIYDTTPKSLTFSSETDVTYPNNNTVNVKADNDFPFDLTEFDLVVVEKTKMSKKSYLEYYKDRDAYTIKQDKDGNNMISLSTFFNFNEEIKITHLCFKDLPTYEVKSQEELTKRILSAKEGDIIKLANNIDITNDTNEAINRITKKITLDLNGKTITMSNKMSINRSPIEVNTGGELTITGNGVIDSTLGGDAGYSIRVYGGGKVIIESGTFKGDTTSLFVINGYATIKGGYFEAKPWFDGQNGDPYRYTLNCLDGSPCDIQVQGGTFYRYDPEHSYSEDPAVNFVSSGYECEGNTINDDTGDYKKTEYKYYEVTKTFSNTQGLRNLYVNDKGLYEPESIYGCLSSETLISSSIPFEFGETQNIFFFKKGSEDKINLEFKLDFQNETSYNFYKDKIYIKNDIPNKILKCEPIEQKIADCKIELPMNSISLDIEGTPASKRIEVVLYSYNTLCQTKLTSGAYTVAELELDSQPTVLEKINSIQAGSIQFNKTEDKYTFDFTKNDAKENPITITFKGDSEHNAITLNEKVLLKDQLQLVEIYNTDTKEDSTTETSQDITIIFSGIVGNSDVSSFILTLNDTDDNIVSPGKNTKIEIKLEDSFCRFDTKDSNTIVLCFGLDFSSLAEGYYYLSYNDSCETPNSNKLSNNNNNDTLLFIKYVQPPEFKIPRHYFSLDTNESPSVTILSPDIAEDIKIYIQKEGETAKIKLELTKINDELKWTYTLTNGIYQLYYSINDGKKHEIVGKIIVVETIDKLIHIDTTNLCFFYKDLIQFDFVTDSQVDYSLIKVYIGSDQNKIEFVKGDNGYSVDLKEKDNTIESAILYIIENNDLNLPLYNAYIQFTNIKIETQFLLKSNTSILFKDMSCKPDNISFSLFNKPIKSIFTSTNDSVNNYTFNSLIFNTDEYGPNKEVFINNVFIGKLFISRELGEATFKYSLQDNNNKSVSSTLPGIGTYTFIVNSEDYYLPNLKEIIVKYKGEAKERINNIDTKGDSISFTYYIGFNDLLNIIEVKDIARNTKAINYLISGPTFTIYNPYYVYPQDTVEAINVVLSFNSELSSTNYLVHYGQNPGDKISLEECIKEQSANNFTCSIPVPNPIAERSIYIDDAINKDEITITYISYNIQKSCQTLLVDESKNSNIQVDITRPSTLEGQLEMFLTNTNNTAFIPGIKNKDDNIYIFSSSVLTYTLNTIIFTFKKDNENQITIFSDSNNIIKLYNQYVPSNTEISTEIKPIDSVNMKILTVTFTFSKLVYYYDKDVLLSLFDSEKTKIATGTCSIVEPGYYQQLSYTFILNENKYGTFSIQYKDLCGVSSIQITDIVIQNINESFELKQSFFIIPNQELEYTITIELQFIPEYENAEKILKVDNNELVLKKTTSKFDFKVDKNAKSINVMHLNNIKTVYIGRYSVNAQTCNTIGFSTNDIILSITYLLDINPQINVTLVKDDYFKESKVVANSGNGMKEIQYIFYQNQFSVEDTYKFYMTFKFSDEESTQSAILNEIPITFIQNDYVINQQNLYITYSPDITNEFAFESGLRTERIPTIILRKNSNSVIEYQSTECTITQNTILSCNFKLGEEEDSLGDYSVFIQNSCKDEIETSYKISILSSSVISILSIEPKVIYLNKSDKNVVLIYNKKLADFIDKIYLIDSNNQESESIRLGTGDTNSSILLKDINVDEGLYYIKTTFKNTYQTFISSNQIAVLATELSIQSVYLEKQQYTNINSITVIKGALVNYINVIFNTTLFEGRIQSVKLKDSSQEIYFKIDSSKTQINLGTSSVYFNSDQTFIIQDIDESKEMTFTIQINTEITFSIEHFIYLYNNATKPQVKITASPSITNVYYKKDNIYYPIPKSTDSYYYYEPSMRNEEVYFAFEANGERKDYNNPVYITNDITTLIKNPFDKCMLFYSLDNTYTIKKEVKDGVKLSISEFEYSFNKNKKFAKVNDSTYSLIPDPKDDMFIITRSGDNLLLFSMDVGFTDKGSIPISYISSSTGTLYLNNLSCTPTNKKLQLDKSINLNCISDTPSSLQCTYPSNLITTYGEHSLYLSDNEIGKIFIYRSLTKEILNFVVPTYPVENENLISFSTNQYDLLTVSISLDNDNITEFKKRTQTEISFIINLSKGNTKNITLKALENGQEKTIEYEISVQNLSFEVSPTLFFLDSNENQIKFNVTFINNKDLIEFKDDLYINSYKLSCDSKNETTALCTYYVDQKDKGKSLSVKCKTTEHTIDIVLYSMSSTCSNESVTVTLQSSVSLQGLTAPDNTVIADDSNGLYSFTFNHEMSIGKGDFKLSSKYVLNNVEFDILGNKMITQVDLYFGTTIYALLECDSALIEKEIPSLTINGIVSDRCILQGNSLTIRCDFRNLEATETSPISVDNKLACNTLKMQTNSIIIHRPTTNILKDKTSLSQEERQTGPNLNISQQDVSNLTFIDITNRKHTFEIQEIDAENMKITIPKDIIGDFSIQGFAGNSVVYYQDILTLYDKDLTVLNGKKQYYYKENNFNIKISFDNQLTERRIVSINANESIDFTKDVYKSSIDFSFKNIAIDSFTLTIKDISEKETILSFQRISSESISITALYYIAAFHNKLEMESTMQFDQITTSNGIEFEFNSKESQLTQKDSNPNFENGFVTFNFYFNNNQDYITSRTIYFINNDTFPTGVERSTIYVQKGASSYTLTFNNKIEQRFFTYQLITLSPIAFLSDSKSVIVSYPTIINTDKTHTFKIQSTIIQVSLKLLTCTPPLIPKDSIEKLECVLCSELDESRPYFNYFDSQCYSQCPEGTFEYNYQCVDDCSILQETPYLEEGKCVSKCSSHYGRISKYSNKCVLCKDLDDDKIAIDGYCEAECVKGAVLNVNNSCVLPNTLYENFTVENKCDNYCKNGANCTLINNDPYCECPEGTYGVICEINNSAGKSIEEYFEELEDKIFPTVDINGNRNEAVDVTIENTKVASNIREMVAYNKQNKDYINKMNSDKKDLIVKSTQHTLNSMINNKNPHQHVFELVGLALVVQLSKINSVRNLRQLDATVEETIELINQSHEAFKILAMNDDQITDGIANILTEPTHTIYYQYSLSSYSSLQERDKNCIASGISVINFIECPELGGTSHYYIITTDISDSLRSSLNNDIGSTLIAIREQNSTEDTILECAIQYRLALLSGMNVTLYNEYISKGIDIYNANDKAFTEKCYFNKDLDYDTTAVYRRKNIYQNKTIILNQGCSYVNETKEHNYIVVKCTLGSNIGYTIANDVPLENINDKERDVPITCPNKIDTITHNIGFWIYATCLFSIIVFSTIFLIFVSKDKDKMLTILKSDKIIKESITFSKVANTENVHTTAVVKPEDVKVEIKKNSNDSFKKIILENFLELHPIPSLTHPSIINPLILCWWIFITNSLNLFGFNALYFNDTKIEKRITHSDRDNFGYPMKHEFDKIIYSILTTLALNVVARAIYLVTVSQRKDLESKVEGGKSLDEKEKAINEFVKSMLPRRLLAVIFLVIVNVFFFYYVIVFCGIYINTQYGWAYSGVWSLFFNWVIFANIEIGIISILEYNKVNEDVVYYLKKLFLF